MQLTVIKPREIASIDFGRLENCTAPYNGYIAVGVDDLLTPGNEVSWLVVQSSYIYWLDAATSA